MEPRQLIIMRHATADPDGHRDHERSLSVQGLNEARRVGLSLRSKGPIPDRILCSSAVRCRQTWQAVSAELECSAKVDFQDDLYNASAASLLHSLAAVGEEQTVLLLAHNPGVSVLTHELAAGDEEGIARLRVGFAPATLACFEVEAPWSLLSPASARLTRLERAPEP